MRRWDIDDWTILRSATSLLGSRGVTTALGVIYWWFVARYFQPTAVGLAAACISAMTLLGTLSMLGLGTLLISELPRRPGKELSLVSAALALAGAVGLGLGLAFALVAPHLSADFEPLRAGLRAACSSGSGSA